MDGTLPNNKIATDAFFNNAIQESQILIIDKKGLVYQKNELLKTK